jgi:hypothetical protein
MFLANEVLDIVISHPDFPVRSKTFMADRDSIVEAIHNRLIDRTMDGATLKSLDGEQVYDGKVEAPEQVKLTEVGAS